MRLTIELEPGREPIKGWLEHAAAPRRDFEGMLELLALLEDIRRGESVASARPPRGGTADVSTLPGPGSTDA